MSWLETTEHFIHYNPETHKFKFYVCPSMKYLRHRNPVNISATALSRLTRSKSLTTLDLLRAETRAMTSVRTACATTVDEAGADSQIPILTNQDAAEATLDRKLSLLDLPLEIQEMVLDNVFGKTGPLFPRSTGGTRLLTDWAKSLRHARRKTITDLALVTSVWTILVQRRIYKSLRIEATKIHFIAFKDWFHEHPHLCDYVRSIEFWFPIKAGRRIYQFPPGTAGPSTYFGPHAHDFYLTRPSESVSVEELLDFAKVQFERLTTLVFDGGSCKNALLVKHYRDGQVSTGGTQLPNRPFPIVPQVRSLIMRGSYNLARNHIQLRSFMLAFPNLEQFDCSYWPFTATVHCLMVGALRITPASLRHLTLNFDSLCGLGELFPVTQSTLCPYLGIVASRMESFTLTGRICGRFFTFLLDQIHACRGDTRLHTLNISVESLCNDCEMHLNKANVWHPSVSGFYKEGFIQDFEAVTQGAMYTLQHIATLQHIKIRTLEIDSHWLLYTPYFEYNGGAHCKGFWSVTLVATLKSVRKGSISYLALESGIKAQHRGDRIVGVVMPKCRPDSLLSDAYQLLRRFSDK